MLLEDRVVTTDQLCAINRSDHGWLQLGPGILDRLDPLGFHVLVPAGHLHLTEDDGVMSCIAQLQTGETDALSVRVLVPHHAFIQLPRAFDVLSLLPAIAAAIATDVEDWLADTTSEDLDEGF